MPTSIEEQENIIKSKIAEIEKIPAIVERYERWIKECTQKLPESLRKLVQDRKDKSFCVDGDCDDEILNCISLIDSHRFQIAWQGVRKGRLEREIEETQHFIQHLKRCKLD